MLAATLACQSAQKTSFMPAPQAQAPALVAANSPPDPHQKPAGSAAAPQSKPQVPQALEVDPVADLIARVEKEYQAGQDNYRAGHLEAAKQNFDSAFNQLLGSGFDLRSDTNGDDRLQRELDRILEGINGLELAALQQGDGFAEQKSEPAPIDEANELNPPVDQNVKAKAEAEIKSTHSDLPLVMTDQVAGYINYYSNRGRGTLERALARSGRYEDMIRRTLQEEGVPQELIYLAQAESGFHPLAVSRAGARGMWQFMGSRAKGYGLERSWWVDDRQDPEKATRAAAHHLKDLYNQFGDWYLAMAAYNSGPGRVQSAVKRTGYADFWELYKRNVLPRETKNYVPIIIALTLIAKDAAHYNIQVEPETPVPTDVVKPGRAIDLRLLAETIDVDVETLRSLNPSLLRLATPEDPSFELHLPPGTAQKFSAEIADIPPDKWVSWRRHRVESGETLTSIAKKYRVTAAAIADANNLERNAALDAGEKLIIPATQPQSETKRRLVSYRVRRGDTFLGIADRFSVSADDLRKWNRLKANRVSRGMVLRIYTLGGAPEASPARARSRSKKKPSQPAAGGGSGGAVAANHN